MGVIGTERLELTALTLEDAEFIRTLLNSPGWLTFIGDRKVKTVTDARNYIQKVIDNPDIHYWIARLKDNQTPIGVISLIKREYLKQPDLGFAFLPAYNRQGYAFEASSAVLKAEQASGRHPHLYAITVNNNTRSIGLLERLGFRYEKEIKVNNENVLLYSVAVS